MVVTGTMVEGQSTVFGLTPQELRYLKVNILGLFVFFACSNFHKLLDI